MAIRAFLSAGPKLGLTHCPQLWASVTTCWGGGPGGEPCRPFCLLLVRWQCPSRGHLCGVVASVCWVPSSFLTDSPSGRWGAGPVPATAPTHGLGAVPWYLLPFQGTVQWRCPRAPSPGSLGARLCCLCSALLLTSVLSSRAISEATEVRLIIPSAHSLTAAQKQAGWLSPRRAQHAFHVRQTASLLAAVNVATLFSGP